MTWIPPSSRFILVRSQFTKFPFSWIQINCFFWQRNIFMNSQTLNVAISRNCKKRYHGCKEDHWRVPSKFFLPTIHLFLDFKCVELYGMSFDSEYYSVFTIIESLIRERFYYSFLFVIGRGLEYHRYQWKKWKAKSSGTELYVLFFLHDNFSVVKKCNDMSSWTVDKLVTAQVCMFKHVSS